jgi:predicted regulator of Ras-like GTPase activity (Roadblock/LC7/MglB family)
VATIVGHLKMLRDVQGVYGSFVVASSGALVDRDLPGAFDESLFAEVGPRVARLFETFVSGGREMDACMLRFAEHKVYVRKMTWGLIGVLSSAAINLPALRMVLNLVVRRIDPEMASGAVVSTFPKGPSGPPAVPSLTPRPQSVRPEVTEAAPVSQPPASFAPRSGATPPPLPVQAVPVTDEGEPPPPSMDRPVRMYRGRPVLDD